MPPASRRPRPIPCRQFKGRLSLQRPRPDLHHGARHLRHDRLSDQHRPHPCRRQLGVYARPDTGRHHHFGLVRCSRESHQRRRPKADGYSSTTLYTNGLKSASYITNADVQPDNWGYNVSGQSYTTQHQHLDASGNIISITRTHADGSLDFTQVSMTTAASSPTPMTARARRPRRSPPMSTDRRTSSSSISTDRPGLIQHEHYSAANALQYLRRYQGRRHPQRHSGCERRDDPGRRRQRPFFGGAELDHHRLRSRPRSDHQTSTPGILPITTHPISKLLAPDYSHLQMTQAGTDVTSRWGPPTRF